MEIAWVRGLGDNGFGWGLCIKVRFRQAEPVVLFGPERDRYPYDTPGVNVWEIPGNTILQVCPQTPETGTHIDSLSQADADRIWDVVGPAVEQELERLHAQEGKPNG